MTDTIRDPAGTDWVKLAVCGCCGDADTEPAGRAQGVGLLRCGACGQLRFEAVRPPDAVYRDGYHTGEVGFGWDYAAAAEGDYEIAIAHQRLAWIERFTPRGSLLDVGGGLGYVPGVAARRGWDAHLLEPVEHAARYAEREFGIPVHVGGADAVGSLGRTWDVISYVHCIEHIPPARVTLEDTRRALGPRGVVYIEVPNYGSAARRMLGEDWLGWQAGEHVYLFTRRSAIRLVERAGFEVIAARTYVPGWEGLDPASYAHFTGAAPVLYRAVDAVRRIRGATEPTNGAANGDAAPRPAPKPIREDGGLRRLLIGGAFRGLSGIEQVTGLGTNIQILAKPRAL